MAAPAQPHPGLDQVTWELRTKWAARAHSASSSSCRRQAAASRGAAGRAIAGRCFMELAIWAAGRRPAAPGRSAAAAHTVCFAAHRLRVSRVCGSAWQLRSVATMRCRAADALPPMKPSMRRLAGGLARLHPNLLTGWSRALSAPTALMLQRVCPLIAGSSRQAGSLWSCTSTSDATSRRCRRRRSG